MQSPVLKSIDSNCRVFAGIATSGPMVIEPAPSRAKSTLHALAAVLAIAGQLLSAGGCDREPIHGNSPGIRAKV